VNTGVINLIKILHSGENLKRNIFKGTSGLLAMTFGFLISGIVISKFQPRPRIVLFWNVIAGLFYVGAEIFFIYVGCPDDIVHGSNMLGKYVIEY